MTCKTNHVESTDIVDDVNSLLKLRVGDHTDWNILNKLTSKTKKFGLLMKIISNI